MLKKVPTVILTGPPPEIIGGVATHMRSLLDSSLAREFNIIFLDVGAQAEHEPLWLRVRRVLCKSVALYRLLRRHTGVILHLNPSMNTKSLIRDLLLAIVGKLGGAKLFIQFHGGRLNRVNWASWPLFKQILYAILKRADLITVLSKEQLESIRVVYGSHCQQLKLQCLPANFLDVQSYQCAFSKRSHSDSVRFLFLGRVIREKGIFEILEAFDIVRKKVPRVSLAIAGTGPDLEVLQRLCENRGLLPTVEFLGFVTGEQKIEALCQSDVFLLPTSWAEGLPYALLEAMAAGLPVIASPNGAITEIVQDGVHGLLVPPKDSAVLAEKMLTLARDPALREKMGEASRASVSKHFSLERQREVFGQIYRQLLVCTNY